MRIEYRDDVPETEADALILHVRGEHEKNAVKYNRIQSHIAASKDWRTCLAQRCIRSRYLLEYKLPACPTCGQAWAGGIQGGRG